VIWLPAREPGRPNGISPHMKLIRNSQRWGPGYIRQRLGRMTPGAKPPLKHIWVTMADHYEPRWLQADWRTAQSRVALWRAAWPTIARRCKPDSAGNPPRYTFFFPEEEYHPKLMEPLAEMVREGTESRAFAKFCTASTDCSDIATES
jgi:hypothetical protein